MNLPDRVDLLLALSALLALWVGWLWKLRPKWRRFWDRFNGTMDAITGRDAQIDYASGRQLEAVRPMTTRMANVEDAIVLLTEQQGQVAALQRQVASLQAQVAEFLTLHASHGERIKSLEDSRLERVVTHMDSALAWKAFAQASGDDDTDPIDPPDQPAPEEP